jgi:TolB protein
VSIRVAGGEHAVSLTDVAANCDVTSTNPLFVPAVSSNTVPAAYTVVCGPVTRLAYTSSSGDIFAIDSNGSRVLRLTEGAQGDDSEWSPDGRRVAFTSFRDGQADILVMDADGSNTIRVTTDAAADYQPTWSADGRRIAFVSERDGNAELYVVNADGSNPQRLTNSLSRDTDPAWSPDGGRIAFASNRDGEFEIYLMNADGTQPARLTSFDGDNLRPAWSPDGNQLAFEYRCTAPLCSTGPIVHVIGATGGPLFSLTIGQEPTWSPDGRKIAYTDVICDSFQYYYVTNCRTAEIRIIGVDGRGDVALLNAPASKPAWRR